MMILEIIINDDRFLKVGNSSKENEKKENVSWRQNILKNVSQDEKPAASKVHHDDLIKLLPVKSKKSRIFAHN